jgi:hypothetical protein
MELKIRKRLTVQEYEKRGEALEKDITKHALYYPISVQEILEHWQPEPGQKAN